MLSGKCRTQNEAGKNNDCRRFARPEGKDRLGYPVPVPLSGALATMVISWLLSALPVFGAEAPYLYPFADPYVATVIGTPKKLRAEVPGRIPVSYRKLTVYEDRPIPAILWYDKRLRYSVATQEGKAPLIFIIPGM
jgi:hypothetical protein